MTSAPADHTRIFVAERAGRVAEATEEGVGPYADLTDLVACCDGERGLLSIALDPEFATNGRFYAAYTGKPAAGGAEGDIHVDAFVAGAGGALTRNRIVTIDHTQGTAHNGGQLQFGPDGYLYISTGDGAAGGDPFENAQDLDSLLGKILRIEPEPGSEPPYSIPPGNPYAGSSSGADEIWSFGLRNPWRFSFDRLSGDMLIGDVGQGLHEEVDRAPSPEPGVAGGAGTNYGWSCREGLFEYPDDGTPTQNCIPTPPTRSSTTRTPTREEAPRTVARSPAATWSAMPRSGISTGATSMPTSASARSARSIRPRLPTAPRARSSPIRLPSARTPAGGSTSPREAASTG